MKNFIRMGDILPISVWKAFNTLRIQEMGSLTQVNMVLFHNVSVELEILEEAG